jgi:hypothetical protein
MISQTGVANALDTISLPIRNGWPLRSNPRISGIPTPLGNVPARRPDAPEEASRTSGPAGPLIGPALRVSSADRLSFGLSACRAGYCFIRGG